MLQETEFSPVERIREQIRVGVVTDINEKSQEITFESVLPNGRNEIFTLAISNVFGLAVGDCIDFQKCQQGKTSYRLTLYGRTPDRWVQQYATDREVWLQKTKGDD